MVSRVSDRVQITIERTIRRQLGVRPGMFAYQRVIALGFDKEEAQIALAGCAAVVGGASFGDALIAACARSQGVNEIYSFDRRFARSGMEALLPE